MPSTDELCEDLAQEHAALDFIVNGLSAADWDRPTPSEGWTIRDQIAHLAFFDRAAGLAARDPEAFDAERSAALADPDSYGDRALQEGRVHESVLEWWRDERQSLLAILTSLDARDRVPWYGPPMSVASMVSARLMETWAHGQDVEDTTGDHRTPSARLRHVAHLAVGARPFSYFTRGLPVPSEPVFVALQAPGGDEWTWGEPDADSTVRGSALDFCLVLTQRRHVDDVRLEITGDAATEWLHIGQAFAGPPGPGRKSGQFDEFGDPAR
jgi:uncharacterized protein (TIGR03084 family)